MSGMLGMFLLIVAAIVAAAWINDRMRTRSY
jgi:hypothetical protein